MLNNLITHLQLFGIGFSFGIAGPCLLVCGPIAITYIAGRKKKWRQSLPDVFIFLSGRLAAYAALGYAAGLSGALLRRFTSPALAALFKPAAGILSIIFALLLFIGKDSQKHGCDSHRDKIYDLGGFFALGFVLGVSPCAPLAALLFEIALMSKSAFDGMSYALSFGMGTFLSGLLVIGMLAGAAGWLPARFLRSNTGNLVFKIICGLLLVGLGVSLIMTVAHP